MFLQLGDGRLDVTEWSVVVGALNRTRDSFFDRGAFYGLDRLLAGNQSTFFRLESPDREDA
jgi:dihydropteroate synthase